MLSNRELRKLIETSSSSLCLSMYMPIVHTEDEDLENPIRYRQLVREAEERFAASSLRKKDVKELLDPISERVSDKYFWLDHRENGLAVFRSPDLIEIDKVPLSFEQQVYVGNRFLIKPLLPLFTGDGQFYILALSQNQVRFFKGTRYHIGEVELVDVPKNMTEALAGHGPTRHLEGHVSQGATAGGSKPTLIFHGNGSGTLDKKYKNEILRYFQKIDHGLQEILADEKAPLVLAGVDYLHPIYREANSYPHLVPQGIGGNPEDLSAEELHQQAWKIVQPIFQQEKKEAMSVYWQQMGMGSGRASKDIREIVPAACYGRIAELFLQEGQAQWGSFDPNTGDVCLNQESQVSSGDTDLLDYAAAHTILHHGKVYVLGPDEMPELVSAAANFRY